MFFPQAQPHYRHRYNMLFILAYYAFHCAVFFAEVVLKNMLLPFIMLNGGYSQNGAGRGLRGTFAHGSMLDVWLVPCSREKLTFGELLFAPFAWIRLGWYLQTISVLKELENQTRERVRARFSIFSDQWQVSSACGTQNNVQHCRLACTVTRTAVVGGKRRVRLGFVSPHRNRFYTWRFGCSGFVFAVIGFCHRL